MKRINCKLVLSYDSYRVLEETIIDVKDLIAGELCKKYGGLTMIDVSGYWCDDADKSRDTYNSLNNEEGFEIQISCEPEKFDEQYIKESCRFAKMINCEWIHFETWETESKHFKL